AGFTLTGNLTGSVAAKGLIKAMTLTGNLAGAVEGGSATTLTVNGAILTGAVMEILNSTTTLSVTGQMAGTIHAGAVTTLKVGGLLASTGSIILTGNAGSVTFTGGTDAGSLFQANQSVS